MGGPLRNIKDPDRHYLRFRSKHVQPFLILQGPMFIYRHGYCLKLHDIGVFGLSSLYSSCYSISQIFPFSSGRFDRKKYPPEHFIPTSLKTKFSFLLLLLSTIKFWLLYTSPMSPMRGSRVKCPLLRLHVLSIERTGVQTFRYCKQLVPHFRPRRQWCQVSSDILLCIDRALYPCVFLPLSLSKYCTKH